MPIREWSEIKGILNNPNASEKARWDVLRDWVNQHEDGDIPPEVVAELRKYALNGADLDELHVDDAEELLFDEDADLEFDGHDTSTTSNNADAALRRAQQEIKSKEGDGGAKEKLDGIKPPGPGGAGAKTSDEIFDAGAGCLEMFKTWIPLLNDRHSSAIGALPNKDLNNDIYRRYDEQRGINFAKFLTEADKVTALAKSLSGLKTDSEGQLNKLFESWEGDAAKAAAKNYTTNIQPHATELIEDLDVAGKSIPTTVDMLFKVCKTKVTDIANLRSNVMGKADPAMARKIIDLSKWDSNNASDDQLRSRCLEITPWLDALNGTNMTGYLIDDSCDMEDGIRADIWNAAINWQKNSMSADLKTVIDSFNRACDNAYTQTNSAYDQLNQTLTYKSEFPKDAGGNGTDGTDTGKGKGSGIPGGGGGTPGGGGGTPGGGGGTPPKIDMPKPENPLDKDGDGKPDNPLDKDGDGKPDGETSAAAAQDEMTVKNGQGDISVQKPDANGHVKTTVDPGNGQPPKAYDVDFSGKGGPVPLGPDGKPKPNPDGSIPVKAGPDGKAVIKDGDQTITMRTDPKTGEITMSVDNGDGKPAAEYGFDFADEPKKPGLDGAAPLDLQAERVPGSETGLAGEVANGGMPVVGEQFVGASASGEGSLAGAAQGADSAAATGQPAPGGSMPPGGGVAGGPGGGLLGDPAGGMAGGSGGPAGSGLPGGPGGGFPGGSGGPGVPGGPGGFPGGPGGGFPGSPGGFPGGQPSGGPGGGFPGGPGGGFGGGDGTAAAGSGGGGFAPGGGQPGGFGGMPGGGGAGQPMAGMAGQFGQGFQDDEAERSPSYGGTHAAAADPNGSSDQNGRGTAPDGPEGRHGASAGAGGSPMGGGMGMMGGMGGAGGGQGGGDAEHKGGKWRTQGNIFDDERLAAPPVIGMQDKRK